MRGYSMDREDLLVRLRKIEGQVRGLQRMVADDEYCIDVLTQLSSATAALEGVAIGLVDGHLRHCVLHAAEADGAERDARVGEAMRAIERLVRS